MCVGNGMKIYACFSSDRRVNVSLLVSLLASRAAVPVA